MQVKTFVKLILAAGCLSVMTLSSLSADTLFEDDFDKGKLNPEWRVGGGEWKIEEGCLTNKDGGSINIDVDKEGGWIFSCDLRMSSQAKGYPAMHICFIEQVSRNYYQLYLKAYSKDEGSSYHLWQKEFDKNVILRETSSRNIKKKVGYSGLKFDLDKWYKLKIEFKNNGLLCFYWDNKMVLKETSHELSPDKITVIGNMKGINLDNVKIEGDKSSPIEKNAVFEDNFSDVSLLKLSGHENNKEVKSIPGNRVETADGQSLKIIYNFRTEGHDAFMISKDINVEKCEDFSINVKGNDLGHSLSVVLTDASGENHYIGRRFWKSSDWCTLSMNFSDYLNLPFPGIFDGNHWGGDGNQKIDFPIKKITVCVDDIPDSFIGKGEIELGKIIFFADIADEKKGIVKNMSFEEIDDRGMPVGWRVAGSKVELRLDHQEVHSGGTSAYIKRTLPDEGKPSYLAWYQYLELAPNTTYKASCWIKADIKKGGRIVVLYMSLPTGSKKEGNRKYYDKSYGKKRGTFDWTYFEHTFTTPKKPLSRPEVYPVLFYGQGEVWIDDVKIVEAKRDGEK